MTYDWEDAIQVVGVALMNTETGEGCFKLLALQDSDDIIAADILQDVKGDVQAAYEEALERSRK